MRKAAEITETMLYADNYDPAEHQSFQSFFEQLYWKVNSLDKFDILDLLKPGNECEIQFRTVGEKLKIIDDSAQKSILVPYRKGAELIEMLKRNGPERWLLRKLQRYTVNIYTNDFALMKSRGSIIEVVSGIFALISTADYNEKTGLLVNADFYDPENLMM